MADKRKQELEEKLRLLEKQKEYLSVCEKLTKGEKPADPHTVVINVTNNVRRGEGC